MAKKILLFCPPFNGHLTVFKNLIRKHQNEFDFHLCITGWNNIEPNLDGVSIPVTILAHSNLNETDPAIWTLPRAVELIDDCLDLARELKPDLIVYDFFSIKGYFVGKILSIPFWSSIPALIGPFTQQSYLEEKLSLQTNIEAIDELQTKFPGVLDPQDFEMVSDGIHLAGQKNLLWSYPSLTPTDFRTNRAASDYHFVGHSSELSKHTEQTVLEKPLVYFSFGTVVMDNLWNQQEEMRDRLFTFINAFAEFSKNKNFDVLFVNRGKPVPTVCPSNWNVVGYADQVHELSRASIFITHAGSNSFHEAVIEHVPMIAIPFFGDQPLVAHQIEALGLGINLVPDTNIDTKKSKSFLDVSLAEKTIAAIEKILKTKDAYQKRFEEISLEAEDVVTLLHS